MNETDRREIATIVAQTIATMFPTPPTGNDVPSNLQSTQKLADEVAAFNRGIDAREKPFVFTFSATSRANRTRYDGIRVQDSPDHPLGRIVDLGRRTLDPELERDLLRGSFHDEDSDAMAEALHRFAPSLFPAPERHGAMARVDILMKSGARKYEDAAFKGVVLPELRTIVGTDVRDIDRHLYQCELFEIISEGTGARALTDEKLAAIKAALRLQ